LLLAQSPLGAILAGGQGPGGSIMTDELKRELGGMKLGEHLCPIHENLAEEIAGAVFFIKMGLVRSERCLYLADHHSVEKVLGALGALDVDIAHERARGALRLLTDRDGFLPSDKFDPTAMIDFLRGAEAEALADGFSAARVIVEKTWLMELAVSGDRLIEYERRIDQFLPNSRIVLICQYNRARFSPAVIHDVLLTHALIILGDQVCPNPFFEPPELAQGRESQLDSDLMARRVDWRISQLKKARAAAQEREHMVKRLQTLSGRLLAVQEDERRHLARELHDEFGQILATITLHLHAALGLAGASARPRLDECAKLLQQAGEQVRSLAIELRPSMLDTLGLEATLRWLAEQHQQRTGCEVQVVGHLSGAPLSPDLAISCFRVSQEALTNVVRHAAARHVWIEVSQSDRVLELVVRDDGVGFDVAPTQQKAIRRGSLGLLGMAERVQLLGGTLYVESEPGRGTRIRASFPLSEASKQGADPEE
jgi:signal transduction histidine kinase